MSDIEIKVFLKMNDKEIKDIIGINFENKIVIVKNFFQNGNRQKIDGYYRFDDVYFKIAVGDKMLTINSILAKE